MNKKGILIILVLLVVTGVVFALIYSRNNSNTQSSSVTDKTTVVEEQQFTQEEFLPPELHIVIYDESGFSPSELKSGSGTNIELENKSNSVLNIEFVGRPDLNSLEINPGEYWLSIPFTEPGIYEFINADNNLHTGTIEIR